MTTDVVDQKNEKVGTIELPDGWFNVPWKPNLVHQVLVAQAGNRRKPLAYTKDRGEVAGSGKKPWKQKHTGRARAGSAQSPLWRGGGVTFGPSKERDFSKKVSKTMKRSALASLLSKKMKDGEVKIVAALDLPNHRTKGFVALLRGLLQNAASALFVPARGNRNLFLSGRNVPAVSVLGSGSLNVQDCLRHKFIVFDERAIPEIVSHYRTNRKRSANI